MGVGGGEAVPPFNRTVSVEPTPGDLVVFPPWLVHSVPSGDWCSGGIQNPENRVTAGVLSISKVRLAAVNKRWVRSARRIKGEVGGGE